jgi:hypothetical protein
MTEFIKTDNNIMVNLKWVKEIKLIDDCYRLKLHLDIPYRNQDDNINEYKVCKNNIESYQKLDKKFGFSKK